MNTTKNEELAELERTDKAGAPAKIRSKFIVNLNETSKPAEQLVKEVQAALGCDDNIAEITARILKLEHPGKL